MIATPFALATLRLIGAPLVVSSPNLADASVVDEADGTGSERHDRAAWHRHSPYIRHLGETIFKRKGLLEPDAMLNQAGRWGGRCKVMGDPGPQKPCSR